MTDVQTPPGEAQKKPAKKGNFWKELPILLGAAVVVALLVRTFVVQTFYVPSDSMEHTLNLNDRVLVNKLVYDFRDPRRGEVIVFTSPLDWREDPSQKDFVKRVIGVPGDHVVCCDGQGNLTINGVSLAEPYIQRTTETNQASPDTFDVTVPAGRLWVMGDNRPSSADSRYHFRISKGNLQDSTIPISSVIGRAFVLFWPVGRATWLDVPDGFSKIPDPAPAKP
ncbi:MAG TPA: signal peptidase I [Micromonosporaceae bacterium]|nr:signal peptidase I [Micromonosporaceae bacterium]